MKKIIITGSKGRIGIDIKDALSREYEIIEIEENDLINNEMFIGVNTIIHLAALTPKKNKDFTLKEYVKVNVGITKIILDYAIGNNVKKVIIPTSWSWIFKLGDYQYSKLLQEKVAREYKEQGLNVVLLELPEVINKEYQGAILKIIERIKQNQETKVDQINISTIETKELFEIFKLFIEDKEQEAYKRFNERLDKFNLYDKIKRIIKQENPEKLKYLIEGNKKVRSLIVNENKTLTFPDYE